MAKTKDAGVVYQLKITLRDIKPPIWRRVQVKDGTLSQLHNIIQTCLEWSNSHLDKWEQIGDFGLMFMTLDEALEYISKDPMRYFWD